MARGTLHCESAWRQPNRRRWWRRLIKSRRRMSSMRPFRLSSSNHEGQIEKLTDGQSDLYEYVAAPRHRVKSNTPAPPCMMQSAPASAAQARHLNCATIATVWDVCVGGVSTLAGTEYVSIRRAGPLVSSQPLLSIRCSSWHRVWSSASLTVEIGSHAY